MIVPAGAGFDSSVRHERTATSFTLKKGVPRPVCGRSNQVTPILHSSSVEGATPTVAAGNGWSVNVGLPTIWLARHLVCFCNVKLAPVAFGGLTAGHISFSMRFGWAGCTHTSLKGFYCAAGTRIAASSPLRLGTCLRIVWKVRLK